jgi:hypothetical protein
MGSNHTEDEEKSEFYAWVLITQNPKKNKKQRVSHLGFSSQREEEEEAKKKNTLIYFFK